MPSLYQTAQDTDTPLARWRFEETSGTTFADSVGSVTATLTGAVTPGVADAGPYLGYGLGADFAGGSASITGVSAWRPRTIEALVRFDSIPSTSSTARPWVFGHDAASSAPIPLYLGFNLDATHQGLLQFGFYTGSAFRLCQMATQVPVGQKLHIVGTYDGSDGLWIYVNGVVEAFTSVVTRPTLTGVSSTAWIGRRYDNTATIDGQIYDLALYNGALNSTRVTAHYTASQQIAGLDINGGGDWTGFGGAPRVQGGFTGLRTGGKLAFTSSVVSVGAPATVEFTAHPADYAATASPWFIEEKFGDGTTFTTDSHSTHIYAPGGPIERVIGSVRATREDANLLAVASASHPTIVTPGPASKVAWLQAQQDFDVQAGDGSWPSGLRYADNFYLAWQRINSGVTIAGDSTLWWSNIVVFLRRYTYAGGLVDTATSAALTVQGVVHDLMGRGVNELVEFDPNRVDPGTPWSTLVPHAAWWNGVSAREVLSLCTTYAPGMWWTVGEPGPSGLPKFSVGRWDGPVRYVFARGATGIELSGGASDLANRALVRYIGTTYGNTRTTWVAEVRANVRGLAEAGVNRTMMVDLTSEGLVTTEEARRRGIAALREAALSKTAGRVTVRAPIMDLVQGRMVEPWELVAGSPVIVADAPLSFSRSTSLAESVGADGVSVFRCRGISFEASTGAATLTLDGGSRSLIGRVKREAQPRRYEVSTVQG